MNIKFHIIVSVLKSQSIRDKVNGQKGNNPIYILKIQNAYSV